MSGVCEAFAQQRDIEAELTRVILQPFLLFGQQVKQQRTEARALQVTRHRLIARASPAAAAAMGENHQPTCRGRHREIARQINPLRGNCRGTRLQL